MHYKAVFLLLSHNYRISLDIGSKAAVHRFISELVTQGLSVILVSSELPEVLGMADRVVVMHQGHINCVLSRAQATPEKVVAAASGSAHTNEELICTT